MRAHPWMMTASAMGTDWRPILHGLRMIESRAAVLLASDTGSPLTISSTFGESAVQSVIWKPPPSLFPKPSKTSLSLADTAISTQLLLLLQLF